MKIFAFPLANCDELQRQWVTQKWYTILESVFESVFESSLICWLSSSLTCCFDEYTCTSWLKLLTFIVCLCNLATVCGSPNTQTNWNLKDKPWHCLWSLLLSVIVLLHFLFPHSPPCRLCTRCRLRTMIQWGVCLWHYRDSSMSYSTGLSLWYCSYPLDAFVMCVGDKGLPPECLCHE